MALYLFIYSKIAADAATLSTGFVPLNISSITQNNRHGHLTSRYILTPIHINTYEYSLGDPYSDLQSISSLLLLPLSEEVHLLLRSLFLK